MVTSISVALCNLIRRVHSAAGDDNGDPLAAGQHKQDAACSRSTRDELSTM